MKDSKSGAYWRKREEEWDKEYQEEEALYSAHIQETYAYMYNQCQKEIDAFYAKYAKKEGISIADAKERVSKADMEAFQAKAKKYVEQAAADRARHGHANMSASYFSDEANEEMRLYNLTMKINRLEMLKAQIGTETLPAFDELNMYYGDKLDARTYAEYQHYAGILGDTVIDPKKADSIVNASFHNATFSQRIWSNQAMLHSELGKQLTQGLVGGKSSAELARNIRKVFDTSQAEAERLMRTELARVQVGAQQAAYQSQQIEEYEFIGGQSGACDICSSMNGKVFKVSDMVPGDNAPPMHPNCRCSTAPHIDRKIYDVWLDSKAAADGESYHDFKNKIINSHNLAKPIDNVSVNNAEGEPGFTREDLIAEAGTSPIGKQVLKALENEDVRVVITSSLDPLDPTARGYSDDQEDVIY